MSNINKEAYEAAMLAASKSYAKKRKVGCAIVIDGELITSACNYNPVEPDGHCEDESGNTLPSTIHAEVAACNAIHNSALWAKFKSIDVGHIDFYVTHAPCDDCKQAIRLLQEDLQATSIAVHVVSEGMKFDSGKIDYTLIPRIAIDGLAKVLHYGARKYKPNNWRQVDPARYVSAFERHWAAYLNGELIDPETGLPHLSHCMTNLAFLLELGHVPVSQQTVDDYVKKHNVTTQPL